MAGYLLSKTAVEKTAQVVNRVRGERYDRTRKIKQRGSSAFSSSGLQVAIPALITGGNALDGYDCTLYEDGVDEASTGTATGVKALDMAIADDASIGEYVMLFSATFKVTGGEDVG